MPISVADLAKKLEVAPEAIVLHAMELDFDVPDDELIPDEIAEQITKLETGDEIAQVEHEIEEQMDREIIENQQKATAGQKKVPHKKKAGEKKKEEPPPPPEIKKDKEGTIILPDSLTVRELAGKISKPLPLVLAKLKQNGIVASLRDNIDYESAAIVAEDLKVKVKKESAELSGHDLFHGNLSELLADEDKAELKPRPPVISVMGHIDHGKTSLLDYIRQAKVAEGEAGGITQKIGAYQVEAKGELMTFLDTPGHEAFTTMRARGAQATDIAILVVAATEGLKPQSIEAINHAKSAEIPIIVAINKMDLDGANPDLVKGQLAEHELTPEDWGGETPCIPISAKTGQGIDDLLDTVQLVAHMRELKAHPTRRAIGTVIESTVDKKAGIYATVLVNTGTLKRGDAYVVYDQHGKIRSMKNYLGQEVQEAPPSTPVQISGFSALPQAGDLLQVMESERIARKRAEEVAGIVHEAHLQSRKKVTLEELKKRVAEGKLEQLRLIVKAESKGSLEAVSKELEKVRTDEGMVKIIHSGVGEVSESDIMLASAGAAVVIGFGVQTPGRIEKIAEREGVQIECSDIIYHLTERVLAILEGRLEDDSAETVVGSLRVKAIFASNKKMATIGGEVINGKAQTGTIIRLVRTEKNEEGEETETVVGQAQLESLQRGPEAVKEVAEGLECGMKVKHSELTFAEGDRIDFMKVKK